MPSPDTSANTDALAHFRAGRLRPAVEAQVGVVRGRPADVGARLFLAELLCFAGELERADRQLDVLGQQSPERAIELGSFRQILRAEMARRQYEREGRLPDFPVPPTAAMAGLLEAGVELRAGNPEGASSAARAAEEARPHPQGSADGMPFDEFRDLDDLLGGIVEVLTTTGAYLWVPVSALRSLAFEAPRRPRDLLWRRLRLELRDGGGADVCMPVLYDADAGEEDLLLGHRTDWREPGPGLVRGVGQRCFLVSGEVRPVLSLGTIAFGDAA